MLIAKKHLNTDASEKYVNGNRIEALDLNYADVIVHE